MRLLTGHVRVAWLLAAALSVACGSPPHKEMDQAQGAIDAARAAGADRYAATELAAATDALKQANDAVTARDYRLALNFALESSEQAQNAARAAGDTRAKLRGDIERSMAEVKTLITQARTMLQSPEGTRLPRRTQRTLEQRTMQLEQDLQKADAALKAEDYMGAERLLAGTKERVQDVIAALAKTPTSQSSLRRG
jgi:hypothetical protein